MTSTNISRYATGPHKSDMVACRGLLFVSGIVADNIDDDVKAQTSNILAKLEAMLTSANSNKSSIISATIWLANIADRTAVNDVWIDWLQPGQAPSRACVGADLAGPKYLVEIALVAGTGE